MGPARRRRQQLWYDVNYPTTRTLPRSLPRQRDETSSRSAFRKRHRLQVVGKPLSVYDPDHDGGRSRLRIEARRPHPRPRYSFDADDDGTARVRRLRFLITAVADDDKLLTRRRTFRIDDVRGIPRRAGSARKAASSTAPPGRANCHLVSSNANTEGNVERDPQSAGKASSRRQRCFPQNAARPQRIQQANEPALAHRPVGLRRSRRPPPAPERQPKAGSTSTPSSRQARREAHLVICGDGPRSHAANRRRRRWHDRLRLEVDPRLPRVPLDFDAIRPSTNAAGGTPLPPSSLHRRVKEPLAIRTVTTPPARPLLRTKREGGCRRRPRA